MIDWMRGNWRGAAAAASALGLVLVAILSARASVGRKDVIRATDTPTVVRAAGSPLADVFPVGGANPAREPDALVAGAVIASTPVTADMPTTTPTPTRVPVTATPTPVRASIPAARPVSERAPSQSSAARPAAPAATSRPAARAAAAGPPATPTFTQQQFAATATAYIRAHPPTGATVTP